MESTNQRVNKFVIMSNFEHDRISGITAFADSEVSSDAISFCVMQQSMISGAGDPPAQYRT